MAQSCPNCNKVEKVQFPVFQPSINDFRAAELIQRPFYNEENSNRTQVEQESQEASLQLSGSQKTQNSASDLSLEESSGKAKDSSFRKVKKDADNGEEEDEIVIKIGEIDLNRDKMAQRQVSTTEYLPTMLQFSSPQGLLPQFPSWSLVCIGPSSIYSHNSGLPEHQQSGFLSGTNFLLPWDVKVRLEHSQNWAENYEKTRNRKKHLQNQSDGTFFTLKIFIGVEYECKNGHRFIMSGPDTVLRVTGGSVKESGSKSVFSNMPIYFNCPCRHNIAQLSRIHMITPKAPVYLHISPKIRIGASIFTSGLDEIKLSQSAYWILRLPYVYHGEDGPILAPKEITAKSALQYGYLVEGMYGIKEADTDLNF
jgi:protein SMG8